MKHAIIVLILFLTLTGCVTPKPGNNGRWTFEGLSYKPYNGVIGYTGDATITGEEVTFRFFRAPDFSSASNSILKDFIPSSDWGKLEIEYKSKIIRNEKMWTLSGPPFDCQPIGFMSEDGTDYWLIGNFDPQILYKK